MKSTLQSLIAFAGIALLALIVGCRSLSGPRVEPVPDAAAQALEAAYAWRRSPQDDASERTRQAAEHARELAPDWAPPRRLLDELLREELLGIEALEHHRRELEHQPDDPVVQYLAGRLEGVEGSWRFQRALQLDPDFAWGHHGLAWAAAQEGDARGSVQLAKRALERARSGWERTYFSAALARYLVLTGDPKGALEVLTGRLADEETDEVGRIELSVQAARIELSILFQPEAERGVERALALLRDAELTDLEIDQLVDDLRIYAPRERVGSLELQLALAERPGPVRDRKRAELLLAERPTPLALGLLKRSREDEGLPPLSGPLVRAAYFGAGQYRRGVEVWLEDLPRAVLDESGLPRDPALRSIVTSARELSGPAVMTASVADPADSNRTSLERLVTFAEHLVEAGWFREARAVASTLAAHDLDRALEVEERAAAGQELLRDLRRMMRRLEDGEGIPAPMTFDADEPPPQQEAERGLRGFLGVLAPGVQRIASRWGQPLTLAQAQEELERSPVQKYGPIGSLVHPGPWYSAADERAGLGAEGEPVPGLATLMARIGRFGVFGSLLGQKAVDGTVLQKVWAEPAAGDHFGIPWSGTIVWCEGTDLKSRAARLGANIAGAALHEGYWIDIDVLRRERSVWWALARRFDGAQGSERMQRALETRGLRLATPEDRTEARRRERRSISTLLGEADRMRLAVLRDRIDAGRAARVELDEFVELTALHEQGHLCDRTRFLPLGSHPVRVARFLFTTAFAGVGVAHRLEYRAQLVALCAAADPRIAWVEILSAGEVEGRGATPHTAAYRELLSDLLHVLESEVHHHPERWPELDADYALAHQLHWLPPERLRQLARRLAEREGLDVR